MTRFARAHGSKASNERLPEEATSWHVMRRQLQEAQQQREEPKRFILNEDPAQDEMQEWAVFEDGPTKQKKPKKLKIPDRSERKSKDTAERIVHDIKERDNKIKKCKRKKMKKEKIEMCNSGIVEQDKSVKKRKLMTTDTEMISRLNDGEVVPEKHRKKKKFTIQGEEELPSIVNSLKSEKQKESLKSKDLFKSTRGKQKLTKAYKRRKPDEGSTTMYINGREIEVIKFDGFPIKKEDADRLKELRKKMIAKGIPHADIKLTMKLERRKAEKALARERKKVCFHCRKPGHVLSDCPELGDGGNQDTRGMGICFKCGSTEHTHFECRVNRSEGFQFAKCFVCNEQGHIARQCPDNPRGLYPKGGGCRVCSDVTHLKKDCPDLVKEKEEQTITLETLKGNSLEVLDEDLKQQPQNIRSKKKKPVVKF